MNSKGKKNKNRLQGENTHFLHQAKNESIRTIKTLLITHRRTPCLRETKTTTYTHRRTRGYTKVIERVLLTKARFTGLVHLLFNLPRSLKMSPISRVWSSLLLCMLALVVLKSQHGKKNILLVILAHLVGNINRIATRGALKFSTCYLYSLLYCYIYFIFYI